MHHCVVFLEKKYKFLGIFGPDPPCLLLSHYGGCSFLVGVHWCLWNFWHATSLILALECTFVSFGLQYNAAYSTYMLCTCPFRGAFLFGVDYMQKLHKMSLKIPYNDPRRAIPGGSTYAIYGISPYFTTENIKITLHFWLEQNVFGGAYIYLCGVPYLCTPPPCVYGGQKLHFLVFMGVILDP